MGMVDEQNQTNFYDGKIRVVGPDGKEFVKYEEDYIVEFVDIWYSEKTWENLKKIENKKIYV